MDQDKLKHLEFALCKYKQYVTTCGMIEDEAIKRRNDIRGRVWSSNSLSLITSELEKGAFVVGIGTAIVWQDAGKWQILLQKRSPDTIGHPNKFSLPTYAFQPLSKKEKYFEIECSLWHNFLREYYEELFDKDKVMRAHNRVDPRWFYGEDPVAKIINMKKSNSLQFSFIGMGFDAYNLEPNIVTMVMITDESFPEIVRSMEPNWEQLDTDSYDLFGSAVQNFIKDGVLTPIGAFGIARAREVLRLRKVA